MTNDSIAHFNEDGSDSMLNQRPPSGDAFLLKYPAIAIVSFICLYVLAYLSAHGNRSLFFLPAILAVALAIAEIILIAICARNVWQRKWRSAISISIAVLIFLAIPFTGQQSFILLDMIRFHAFSEYYKTSVQHIQTIDNQPKAAFFDWGDTGALGSITLYVLVYDESDDIALKSNAKNSFFYKKNMPARYGSINDERCITSSFPIQGHFYSVTITC